MEHICNFIPSKNFEPDLQFIHFVYETNIKRLPQPFSFSNYYMFLVSKGTANFKSGEAETEFKKGDLFFTFPYQSFTLDADEDFAYLYISFNGSGATEILNNFGIDKEHFAFSGFEHVLQFWMDSIIRINPTNAVALTESVFMYTLSFIDKTNKESNDTPADKFDMIIDYINHNYATKDMSIKKVAGIFFYNEKYLSSLFVKNTGTRFSEYLNNLRISYAKKLVKEGQSNVSEIALKCGYSDCFYFSKVFKKIVDVTPTQYIKSAQNKG